MHHAILRRGARCFFLASGEDGDEGLDQVLGKKDERSTILQKPCVVPLGRLLVPAFSVIN
jgi:hypothetical protein